MSSFRLICITALNTVVLVVAAGAAAAAQTPAEQSGKSYLAGLRPPHDHYKSAHLKTTQPVAQRTPMAKSTRVAANRRHAVAAKVQLHRPVRLADKINSRVAWPSVKPPAADERKASDTVLQFATEETAPNPAPAPHPAASAAPSTIKTPPPAAIAATDERNVDSDVTGTMPSVSTPVQTERFEASPSSQMRVILPTTNAEPLVAPASLEQPTPRSNSTTAQMLATLAGAITAAIVGWLLLGPFRTIKSRQI